VDGLKLSLPGWPALQLVDLEFEHERKLERKGADGRRKMGSREEGS
jgi:hypothetical protein